MGSAGASRSPHPVPQYGAVRERTARKEAHVSLSKSLLAAIPAAALIALPALSAPAPAGPVVTVVATDYHLALPASLPAGATTFQLVNHGHELHQMMVVRLEQGKTEADFMAALRKAGPSGQLPAWAVGVGGPNGTSPGETSIATTVTLQPGHYVAMCVIPSPGGTPHFMKGMITPFTVTAARTAKAAPMPAPDETIKLVDYTFQFSKPLAAGRHVIRVVNAGTQWHELELVRLNPGKTVKDLEAWEGAVEAGKPAGPPPADALGGVAPLDPGHSATMTVDLAPGRYGMLCFLPAKADGKPHFMHGMAMDVDVK